MKLPYSFNAFIFSAVFLLVSACNKNDDTGMPEPTNQNPNRCLLTNISNVRGNLHLNNSFQYDTQRNLVNMNFADNSGIASAQSSYKVETNANGKVVKLTGSINGNGPITSIRKFEYNTNGLLIKLSYYNGAEVLRTYDTYEYNSANLLVKRNSFNHQNEVTGYIIYTYQAPNMAKKVMYQVVDNDTLPTRNIYEYVFDNKKNIDQLTSGVFGEVFPQEHNPLTIRWTVPGIDTTNINYTYTYNSDGFPIQAISYEDGQQVNNTTFTYNCQ